MTPTPNVQLPTPKALVFATLVLCAALSPALEAHGVSGKDAG